jgi:hypothetical protein
LHSVRRTIDDRTATLRKSDHAAFIPDALKKINEELATRTRTALAQSVTAAAEAAAAREEPLPVQSTAQLRELAAAASRVFEQGIPKEMEETPEEAEERIRRLSTPEGQEELRRRASEYLGREQNIELPKLPPTPSAPEIYEVTIRGDGGGVKVTS